MRKAFQIAGAFQLPAAHDRRKAQDFGAPFALARDQIAKARHDILESSGACVNALDTRRQQQRVRERI
jgi:hypothetical protein